MITFTFLCSWKKKTTRKNKIKSWSSPLIDNIRDCNWWWRADCTECQECCTQQQKSTAEAKEGMGRRQRRRGLNGKIEKFIVPSDLSVPAMCALFMKSLMLQSVLIFLRFQYALRVWLQWVGNNLWWPSYWGVDRNVDVWIKRSWREEDQRYTIWINVYQSFFFL